MDPSASSIRITVSELHPGSASGSPFSDPLESGEHYLGKPTMNFDFGLDPYFLEMMEQLPDNVPPLSRTVVRIGEGESSPEIPGLPPQTNLAQLQQTITTLGATLPSVVGSRRKNSFVEKAVIEPSRKRKKEVDSGEKEAPNPLDEVQKRPGLFLEEKGCEKIEGEFKELSQGDYFNTNRSFFLTCQQERMTDALDHPKKNRSHRDIPYNETRFKEELGEEYYNATVFPYFPSSIKKDENPELWDQRTILAANPTQETIHEFWRMGYYAGTKTIVKFTTEEDYNYCYPDHDERLECYGFRCGFLLIKNHLNTHAQSEFQDFTLSATTLSIGHIMEESDKKVVHWTFTRKKEDALLSASNLLILIQAMEAQAPGSGSTLFHARSCLSGIGMLFAVCHYLYKFNQLLKESNKHCSLSVYSLVTYLRENCRYGMIQRLEEYQLIYEFLRLLQNETPSLLADEPSLEENTEQRSPFLLEQSFPHLMPGLSFTLKASAKIEEEFEQLNRVSEMNIQKNFSLYEVKRSDAKRNPTKNSHPDDIPFNTSRFKDTRLDENFYIDASSLPELSICEEGIGLGEANIWKNRALLGHHPTSNTLKDFWYMALLSRTKCIVSIQNQENTLCDLLSCDSHSLRIQEHGSMNEPVTTSDATHSVHSRMLSLRFRNENDMIITHLILTPLKPDSLLDAPSMLAIIKEIKLYSDTGCTLFNSSSCLSGTGTLLAVCHYLFQLHQLQQKHKQNREIDVSEFVMFLREQCRAGMIQSLEEYQFIYQFLDLLRSEKLPPKRRAHPETPEEAAKYNPFVTPNPRRYPRSIFSQSLFNPLQEENHDKKWNEKEKNQEKTSYPNQRT